MLGENTRAAHPPAPAQFRQTPVGLPVYRTAAFEFSSAQEFSDILNGAEGYAYSRIHNPTSDAFAAAVAALEGVGVEGETVGEAFASGMAAVSTTAFAHLCAGDEAVCQSAVYGGTWSLFANVLSRFGVRTTFVSGSGVEPVRAALTERTRLVWVETIANPMLSVSDLPGIAAAAHEVGALLGVDSTFASPAVCRPLEHGVDIVMHSATKFIGGHSDATGGVIAGRPEVIAPVEHLRGDLGGSLSPDEAFLLHRGLLTLPLRVARHSESALEIAEALREMPGVQRVHYPGLKDHPTHELATGLFDPGRYGGVVTVDLIGGRAAGMQFCDRLRLGANVASLGGLRTKVSHVASSTHRQLDDHALAAAGIDPSSVRISIGLEDPADLLADLRQALAT